MPISTVKDIFGAGEPHKTESEWQAGSHRSRQLRGQQACVFALGKTLTAVCALLSFATFSGLKAQTINARISVSSLRPAIIKIDAQLSSPTNTLSFRNTYGGVLGLGERIETVEGISGDGEKVRVQKLAPGEYESAEKFSRFTYEVHLAEPSQPAQMSHVSSLNSDRGVLMTADLLPQSTKDSSSFTLAVIDVDVPTGWTVASNVKNKGPQYSTDDPETAVFLIGPSLVEKSRRVASTDFSIIRSGNWPFSDKDATKIAAQILEEYSRVTRFNLKSNAVVMLIPYPGESGPESWSAETRGNVVVLQLGRKASGKKVLSRLGIVLSHELFHLWVPNSLRLEGNYDWFFEGFTLYQALLTDLRLRLISFDDYLETIAGVFDSYSASLDRDRLSLIEASERRWTTSASMVYEKGMLVAFIYDWSLRKLSDCQASLADVYAELFRLPATGQRSANETIINALSQREELKAFAHDYVESAAKINLDAILAGYGIRVETSGSRATRLIPVRDASTAQRKLLGCVGYRR
jgi:predicted metalloprotease with PDZ domain